MLYFTRGLHSTFTPTFERPDNVSTAARKTRDRPTTHPAFLGECRRLLVWGHSPNGLAAHPRPHRAYFHPARLPVPDEYLEPRYLQRPGKKRWGRDLDTNFYLRAACGDHGVACYRRCVRAHDNPA